MPIAKINCRDWSATSASGGNYLVGRYGVSEPEGWSFGYSRATFKVDLSTLPPNTKINSGTFYLSGYKSGSYCGVGDIRVGTYTGTDVGNVYYFSTSPTTYSSNISSEYLSRALLTFVVRGPESGYDYYNFCMASASPNYIQLDYTLYRPISDGALGGFLNFIVLPKIIPRMTLGLGKVIY